ncbi:putative prephenate dehydrogenase [Aeropyrum pernix K1]|uniref:Prephenate dehydrogenase n=1 Tax=Aeropyrum pernix (strain ATCC 700893 / DSM 11879 / JCM 9820 / NBRC 100138 / K1) TaxID=272557 RepID=Q9YEL6_AERPE|nr:prephenate dehydrogenase [Aeropyrum pernix]BAA79530.2 putative prephenate dehydrogenase [Aeropyrum pernix K1]
MECRVGFVGAGSVARALARAASARGWPVCFYDIDRERAGEAASQYGGLSFSSLQGLAAESEAIVVAVPGPAAGGVMVEAARSSRSGTLVVDTATFKRGVVAAARGMPPRVLAALTHPLFGGRASRPEKHYVAVMPFPGREGVVEAERLYREMGFNTIRLRSWEEHDRLAGYSIGLVYALAEALYAALESGGLDLDSPLPSTTYRVLGMLAQSVLSDSPDLRGEILSNPSTREAAASLASALMEVARGAGPRGRGRSSYNLLYRLLEEC